MSWLLGIGLVLGAYLLGSISFSLLIVRARAGFDVRDRGSGNAGATNVLRLVGKGPAVVTLLLDVAKGAAPVLLARALDAPGEVAGGAALAAVTGHALPLFHGFRGGKGVATAAGALGCLAPGPAGLAALVFAVVIVATRYVSLGSVTAVASFPVLLYVSAAADWTPTPPGWLLASSLAIAILIAARHRDNLRRLASGTERRFGESEAGREPA